MGRINIGDQGGDARGTLLVADGRGWSEFPPGAVDGYALRIDTTSPYGVSWAAVSGSEAALPTATDAGTLAVYDGSDWVILDPPVDGDGMVLTAASGQTEGVEWAAIPSQLPDPGNAGVIHVSDGTDWGAFAPTGASDGNVLIRDSGQTFGVRWGTPKGVGDTLTTDTDGATITFDMASSGWHQVTLGGNRTLALSNVTVGQQFTLILKQGSPGNRTVTWFSGITWITSGGTAPTLSTVTDEVDVFTFKCTGSGAYLGFVVGSNAA